MAKVLLINPNKWGRGITPIWIPAHVAALRQSGHTVTLFDATFYENWTVSELDYNTANQQYRPTEYAGYVTFRDEDVIAALQQVVADFQPDLIFWSALSSHIHGEGEYVNIQYGYDLLKSLATGALFITAGLQATASPQQVLDRFPRVDFLIAGESDLVLPAVARSASDRDRIAEIPGVIGRSGSHTCAAAPRQPIIANLDDIGEYDYTVFEPQVLWRPYNGTVVRAVDYEMSRGCIYACSYCVETVVQRYYGLDEFSPNSGALLRPTSYLRNKSAQRVFDELTFLHTELGVELIRCQDTNFLTINRRMLNALADLLEGSALDVKLYIETRVDRMRPGDFPLLKRLQVDGIGTGIELSSESFRKDRLNRHADTRQLVDNFAKLREFGIRRTTYNIIGLPQETEEMILDTIEFNRSLQPDNITVAFYSPYLGTPEAQRGRDDAYFDDYEYHVDGQLRTVSKSSLVDAKTLNFYKTHFVELVRNGLEDLGQLKRTFFESRGNCAA
jgi:hypothetical protein